MKGCEYCECLYLYNYYPYRIVSKITISSPFVLIRIVSCDDRIVSSLVYTRNLSSWVHLLQSCSRILLPPDVRQSFLDKFKRPMTYLQRKSAKKTVWEKCKKSSKCPYCGAINGQKLKFGYEYITLFKNSYFLRCQFRNEWIFFTVIHTHITIRVKMFWNVRVLIKGLLLKISLKNGPSFLKLKMSETNHNKLDA